MFEDGGYLGGIYTTSKILLGLGPFAEDVLGAVRLQEVVAELREGLKDLAVRSTDEYPFLTVLIAQGLSACGQLDDRSQQAVALWAERFTYRCAAGNTSSKTHSGVEYCLALGAFAHYATPPLPRSQIRPLIEELVDNHSVLPYEAHHAVTRLEDSAVDPSSTDALIFILSHYLLADELLRRADYLSDVITFFSENARVSNSGVTLYWSDVFLASRANELWFNVAVRHFGYCLHECILRYDRSCTLETLHAEPSDAALPWNEVCIGGFNWPRLLADRLFVEARAVVTGGGAINQNGIILFGPPGTGKTSIAASMARELGNWPLIQLNPGTFLSDGPDRLFARINEIFSYLIRMGHAVIFFDELEVLLLERDPAAAFVSWDTALLTSVMLPWFQRLHDWGRNVYILATNHVDRVDNAIRRPSRFDFVLPVGPPNNDERIRLLTTFLGDTTRASSLTAMAEKATIGELKQWAQEIVAAGLDDAQANELWTNHFEPYRLITDEDYDNFQRDSSRYSFPPTFGTTTL